LYPNHRLLAPPAATPPDIDDDDDDEGGSESVSEPDSTESETDRAMVQEEEERLHQRQRRQRRRRWRGVSDGLRAALVTTAEVYRRSRAFIEAVQSAVSSKPTLGGPLELGLARDGLFGAFLSAYPRPELKWMTTR